MKSPHQNFDDPNVEKTFLDFPRPERDRLLELRALILQVASQTTGVGEILEALRWGQPAYLTPSTNSGTTIRLGCPKTGGSAIYTHCQTTVMAEFQEQFRKEFEFDGNRAIHLPNDSPLPVEPLTILIRRALTYHQKAKAN